jgi:hypothetical protein
MKRILLLAFILGLFFQVQAQIADTTQSHYLNIGSNKKHRGFCFGNSPVHKGARFNIIDKNVMSVRGFNVCLLKSQVRSSRGFSVGFVNKDSLNVGCTFGHFSNTGDVRDGIVAAGVFVNVTNVRGISIAPVNKTGKLVGLAFGLSNCTKKLRGIQFGLINYVGNNPKGLRWMPCMNMHFGKIAEE